MDMAMDTKMDHEHELMNFDFINTRIINEHKGLNRAMKIRLMKTRINPKQEAHRKHGSSNVKVVGVRRGRKYLFRSLVEISQLLPVLKWYREKGRPTKL